MSILVRDIISGFKLAQGFLNENTIIDPNISSKCIYTTTHDRLYSGTDV